MLWVQKNRLTYSCMMVEVAEDPQIDEHDVVVAGIDLLVQHLNRLDAWDHMLVLQNKSRDSPCQEESTQACLALNAGC